MEPAKSGSSFGKGLSVLTWILNHEKPRADQIAAGLELPLSSVYRYLRELREHGLAIEQDGHYGPGPRLGGRFAAGGERSLSAIAAPFLEHLARATGETAVLTARNGLNAVCVRQVESTHQIRLAFRTGQLLPLYAGAGQRVLLAYAPDEVQRAILQGDCRPYTPDTPTKSELAKLLTRARAEGIVISRSEITPGSLAMAMPVLSGRYAVAAICVAGPRNRCDAAWRGIARAELAAVVQSMSATLADSQ